MTKMLRSINKVIVVGISILLLSCCVSKTSKKMIERIVSIDTTFHLNGAVCEIYATIDSVRQGLCIGYNTSGIKRVEATYVDGELYGPYIVYNSFNHNIMTKAFYKNGMWDGEFISYYENGSIEYKKIFVNGEANGICYVYTDDGELSQKLMYKNGLVVDVLFNNKKLPLPLPPPVE